MSGNGATLAIVWHSRTDTAEAMARSAAQGAGSKAQLCKAADADAEWLLKCSGYIFACPENLATMSGMMKEMFDRAYYPLLGRIEGRPYATLIAGGSDGSGAQAQIDRIAKGWRLRRIAEPIVHCTDAQTPEAILAPKSVPDSVLAQCHELGAGFAEGLRQGIF
ncbi:flavodoxin family protein [Altererythrobacter sp. CAU 1778]